ncbi:atpase type 13a2 isoform 3 [Stylonychia lemnae]|uniref:Atpase type 13a2 isoform 3 n=1 Tax=Stylonychia lemnae TaxID=5949 RepID=A0A078B129_STYLE|nr:atpase type 13a2 isoform 3 [Stylonychia lemnae]|eukprot:CDW88269.1 atpase type 13a2 isoform 3 [Stylonychia lemnae]
MSNLQLQMQTFRYRFIEFIYEAASHLFKPVLFECELPYKVIHQDLTSGVQSALEIKEKQIKFGKCDIEIPNKTIPEFLITEILNPFYIFQVSYILVLYCQIYSAAVWYADEYIYFASCIIFISIITIIVTLVDSKRNLNDIQRRAHYECKVNVIRDGNFQKPIEIMSGGLVPGDIIEIPEYCVIPCDVILLSGTVVMNESMLTGESVPAIKNPIPMTNDVYNFINDQKYTLYSGTQVIQTRKIGVKPVLGLVIKTGFMTTKGGLIRDILYPRPNRFSFYRDSLLYILVFFFLAIIGYCSAIKALQDDEYEPKDFVLNFLDCITVTVPPILATVMTVGTGFSMMRLRRLKIYCISPPRVNVSGRVSIMVLDKTGTLTEDGLQVLGFRSCHISTDNQKQIFTKFHDNSEYLKLEHKQWQNSVEYEKIQNDLQVKYLETMALCHQITYVKNELIGDPMDVRMFEAINFELDENVSGERNVLAFVKPVTSSGNAVIAKKKDEVAKVVPGDKFQEKQRYLSLTRRFEFESKLQRMSVLARNHLNNQNYLFLKGSPEKVKELSRRDSIPSNYDSILEDYTQRGYRVIALAYRQVNIPTDDLLTITRDKVEDNLTFVGFLIMQNKLKAATIPTLNILNKSKVRCIMATGDNMLTALSVGRKCQLLTEEETVFLGDIVEQDGITGLFWKVSAESEGEVKDNQMDQDRTELDINNQVQPWENMDVTKFSIAVTAKAFNYLRNEPNLRSIYLQVIYSGKIFARMTPDDKAQLVTELQNFCRTEVGMCGDGANDCAALKTADSGISLSSSDASIAAPFSSQIQDISSVVELLKEGRSALVTSFQIFKFVGLYAMIQYMNVILLYHSGSDLGDFQFLWQDLFIALPLCYFMGLTEPWPELNDNLPEYQLLKYPTIISVVAATLIQLGFEIGLFVHTRDDPFNPRPIVEDEEESVTCDTNTVIFQLASFQLLITAVAFSVITFFSFYFILINDQWVNDIFELFVIPESFRYKMLMIIFGDAIATYMFENFVVRYLQRFEQKRQERIKNEQMLEDISQATRLLENFKEPIMHPDKALVSKDYDKENVSDEDEKPPVLDVSVNNKPSISKAQHLQSPTKNQT